MRHYRDVAIGLATSMGTVMDVRESAIGANKGGEVLEIPRQQAGATIADVGWIVF